MSNEQELLRKIREEHQARKILEILIHPVFNGRTNDGIIADALEAFALGGIPAQVRTIIGRMETLDVVRTEKNDHCIIVQLTGRGERVAEGKEPCEGVARFVRD